MNIMKTGIFFRTGVLLLALAGAAACQTDKELPDAGHYGDPYTPPAPAGDITIDGEFGDWDALGAKAITITQGADAKMTDLKVAKLYAEKDYLDFYVEFDKGVLGANDGGSTVHVYIDTDGGNTATGYQNPGIASNYFDYVLEGSVTGWDGDLSLVSYDPNCFQFNVDAGSDWSAQTSLNAGFTSGNGVVDGDVVKYEFQITREMFPVALPDVFNVMLEVQRGWQSSGVLPTNDAAPNADGSPLPAGMTYAWNTTPATPPAAAPVTIDGQFNDWDALKNSAITLTQNDATATLTDLHVAKLYAEKDYLDFYVEFDKGVLGACDGGSIMHLFIDADGGDTQTYYQNPSIASNFFDYVLQGSVTDDPATLALVSYNPNFFLFPPESYPNAWTTVDLGNGFTTGAGVVDGDVVKYEFQITREMLPQPLSGTINVMLEVQRNWQASGVLPSNTAEPNADGTPLPEGMTFAWDIGNAK